MLFVLFLAMFSLSICQVRVVKPAELVNRTNNSKLFYNLVTFPAVFSNFGRIPYGLELSGRLFIDYSNQDACMPLPEIKQVKEIGIMKNPIIVVTRGNCTFVQKVKNVEAIGGKVALIINNIEGDLNVIMIDDGTGSDLTIPGVLIKKSDGDIIRKFVKENVNNSELIEGIVLNINFEMEMKNQTKIEFFYSADQLKVYELLKDFSRYEHSLQNKDKVVPHIALYSDYRFNASMRQFVPNCVSGGEFCGIMNEGLGIDDGRIIVFEVLRQKCIYRMSKKDNTAKFFDYMIGFYDNCLNANEKRFNEECSNKTMNLLNISSSDIHKCVKDSFKCVDYDICRNSILERELNKMKNYGIYYLPSIVVNGRSFLSSWTGKNLLEATCSGINEKPDICFSSGLFYKLKREDVNQGLSVTTIILIVFLIVFVNLGLIFLLKKYIIRKLNEKMNNDEIDERIQSVMNTYAALEDRRVDRSIN